MKMRVVLIVAFLCVPVLASSSATQPSPDFTKMDRGTLVAMAKQYYRAAHFLHDQMMKVSNKISSLKVEIASDKKTINSLRATIATQKKRIAKLAPPASPGIAEAIKSHKLKVGMTIIQARESMGSHGQTISSTKSYKVIAWWVQRPLSPAEVEYSATFGGHKILQWSVTGHRVIHYSITGGVGPYGP